jgi:MFS superfamily sulfate permease-like transporter
MQNQEIIDALTPVVALAVTQVTKWVGPKVPKWALPLIAIAVGTLTNVVATVALDGNQSLAKSVLLGLAAIALREVGKHWVAKRG